MHRRRGQAALEMALVALILIVVVIGVFDLAQVLFIHQTFADRVRNAARYAAVNSFDAAAFKNVVLYNQTTVPSGRTTGVCGLSADMVSVTLEDAGTTAERVVVSITRYPYRLFTPLISGVFEMRPITVSIGTEEP